jgi:hypothetical protein
MFETIETLKVEIKYLKAENLELLRELTLYKQAFERSVREIQTEKKVIEELLHGLEPQSVKGLKELIDVAKEES